MNLFRRKLYANEPLSVTHIYLAKAFSAQTSRPVSQTVLKAGRAIHDALWPTTVLQCILCDTLSVIRAER